MKMQIMVVLAVAVLVVPSLSEGRILSKCELKSLLEAFKFNLTEKAKEKNLTNEDFVAKIVCHIEKATGFNTSIVTPWRDDDGSDDSPTKDDKRPTHLPHLGQRPKRHARHFHGDLSCTESHQFSSSKEHSSEEHSSEEHSRDEHSSKEHSSKEHSSEEHSSEEHSSEEENKWTLYGLFQLSDHVICANGSTPSLNLCQMNCSALIDDDISDDLDCVETIKQTVESGPGEHKMALTRMFKLQKECVMTVASSYFSEC